jgi:hypothetical protein
MTARHVERALWGITLISVAVTGVTVAQTRSRSHAIVHTMPASTGEAVMYDRELLAAAADSVIANDLFRAARHPTKVAFGMPPAPSVALPPPHPRPQLTLGGDIGGPPWRAVVNGVPGHENGVVVSQGDTIAGLRIRSIRRDTVVIQGVDTTWTLTMRR